MHSAAPHPRRTSRFRHFQNDRSGTCWPLRAPFACRPKDMPLKPGSQWKARRPRQVSAMSRDPIPRRSASEPPASSGSSGPAGSQGLNSRPFNL
jgi:hypothetical protein